MFEDLAYGDADSRALITLAPFATLNGPTCTTRFVFTSTMQNAKIGRAGVHESR